jgi:glucan-binding YG repeat protein
MVDGWNLINGVYYYFNENSDGKRGKLLVNTETPDGFHVDENGARIEQAETKE